MTLEVFKSQQNDFPSVNLCAFPFILNAQAKTTMLQTDAELQMQVRASRTVTVHRLLFYIVSHQVPRHYCDLLIWFSSTVIQAFLDLFKIFSLATLLLQTA